MKRALTLRVGNDTSTESARIFRQVGPAPYARPAEASAGAGNEETHRAQRALRYASGAKGRFMLCRGPPKA